MEPSIVCRSCLTTISLEYIDLETPLSGGTTFLDCFNYCTRLQADIDDALPKIICCSCASSLQTSYDFIKTSCDSDSLLRNSLVCYGDLDHIEDNKDVFIYDVKMVENNEDENYQATAVHNSTECEEIEGTILNLLKEETDEKLPIFEVVIPSEEVAIEEDEHWLSDDNDTSQKSVNETLTCKICNTVMLKEWFDSHIKEHTENTKSKGNLQDYSLSKSQKVRQNFFCPWCGEVFNSKSSILKHRLVNHHGKVSSSCLTSGDKCFDESSLQRHVNKEHGIQNKLVVCPYCTKEIKGISQHIKCNHLDILRLPMKSEGDSVKLYKNQCSHCLRYFQSKTILIDHLNTHTGERPYSCRTCGKTFSEKTICERHEATMHLPNDAPRKTCEFCDFGTSNICSFKCHTNRHRQPQKKKYLCAFCPMTFTSPKTLELHEDYKHKHGEKPYKCEVCEKSFYIKRKLKEHNLCVHTKGRPHECSECGKTFKNNFQLKAHYKLHTSKEIQCSQCDKKFCRKIDLRIHMRTHTGELPYECHLCDKRYAIKVRLTYHLQKHMGFKHKCDHCLNEYASKGKLRLHMFKHIGMPYICEICQMGYPNRVGLRRHSKSVHKTILSEEDLVENRRRNEKTIITTLVNNMDLVTGKSIVSNTSNPESGSKM